jgi:hypothetical protein
MDPLRGDGSIEAPTLHPAHDPGSSLRFVQDDQMLIDFPAFFS